MRAKPHDYHLVRSRRRSVAIAVRNDTVEVRAPNRVPLYWINDFVAEKSAWIEKRLIEEAERHQQRYRLEAGCHIPYLGEPREVRVEPAKRNSIALTDHHIIVQAREMHGEYRLKLFQRWISAQAADYLTPRTESMAEQLGVREKLSAVTVRHTRSKWGHCTRQGVVQFNPMIMLAPLAVVDYLVAHEVSHLIHPNHSKAYWDCVTTLCPAHREQRRWLRANEHRFQLRTD